MREEKRNKRQERREKAQQQARTNRLRTMGLIVVGAALLVSAFIYNQAKPITDLVAVDPNPRPNAERNSMGDPKAPIQITEFSDFQCPFCKRFSESTEPLLVDYFVKTGKIHFTYRSAGNWVSGNLGGVRSESQDAAAAAYCAGDQGKFWEMHDALFANNRDIEDQGSFSSKRLSAIAEKVGLDMTAFNDCYKSGKYKDQVQQDFDDAKAAGITGTPFFLVTYKVNGETKTETIDGAQPIDAFQQKIEAALQVADK
jgi:protein-disulfide isomerase